jgi:hypothetical protein
MRSVNEMDFKASLPSISVLKILISLVLKALKNHRFSIHPQHAVDGDEHELDG